MSIDQIASEALRLPAKDRAQLAESLWESLLDPYQERAEDDDDDDDADLASLANERDKQIERVEVQPLTHEQLMACLGQ